MRAGTLGTGATPGRSLQSDPAVTVAAATRAPRCQPAAGQRRVYIAIRPSKLLLRPVRRLVALPTMLSIAVNCRV